MVNKDQPLFTRTAIGLSNYPDFLGARLVVFCEGSTPPSDPNLEVGNLDMVWWRLVLEHRMGLNGFKFVPCGSKSQVLANLKTLLELTPEQQSNAAILGCVDRDYDSFVGDSYEQALSDRLFVTEGYEVENDLLLIASVPKLLKSLTPFLSDKKRSKLADILVSVQ